jgi:hypothetical protein
VCDKHESLTLVNDTTGTASEIHAQAGGLRRRYRVSKATSTMYAAEELDPTVWSGVQF